MQSQVRPWHVYVSALSICCLPIVGRAQATGAPQQAASSMGKVITGENLRLPTTDVQLLRIQFAAGARTYWHIHQTPHLVYVEQGRGRFQTRGGKPVNLGPGEVGYLPAKVPHWHGAAPETGATLLTVYPKGINITMLNEVPEDEYRGAGTTLPR